MKLNKIELDGRVSQGEQRQELILLNIGAIQTSYLPLAGGSMTGDIAMNGKKVTGMGDPTADAQAANKRYVDTRLKRTGGTGQKMEGIFYMGGYKIAGVGDPELSTDAANKKFVEEQIAAIPDPVGGGGPTKKYDGNRFCKSGVSGATLDNGDVMFFNDQLASTTDPAEVYSIALPIDEFDWDKCAYSGIIKVQSGPAVAGCYLVYDYKLMAGKMMILYVRAMATENVALEADSGCPCYFRGVFFE